MSKGLEVLKELKKQNENHRWLEQQFEKEWLNVIEKELKALEIIKEKRVDISWFYYSDNDDKYNSIMEDSRRYLTQEDYDLLKEVLL